MRHALGLNRADHTVPNPSSRHGPLHPTPRHAAIQPRSDDTITTHRHACADLTSFNLPLPPPPMGPAQSSQSQHNVVTHHDASNTHPPCESSHPSRRTVQQVGEATQPAEHPVPVPAARRRCNPMLAPLSLHTQYLLRSPPSLPPSSDQNTLNVQNTSPRLLPPRRLCSGAGQYL